MILINIKGGTGNQLFQYALGRHLALKNHADLKLGVEDLQVANKLGNIYRPFALSHFAIQATVATSNEVRSLKYPHGFISKAWRFLRAKLLRRHYITFDPTVLTWKDNLFVDGYFQSPLYFNSIRETLLKELTLKEPLSAAATTYADQIKGMMSVSIHVRRGDYIKNPRVHKEFGVCSVDYYAKAITRITELVPSPAFFIFSDDIEWVKENLPVGDNAIFVQDQTITDVEELMLMSMCKHNIIANSSFSWWGAWLNQNPSKRVIAPTPWFQSAAYDPHLIPQDWIQLPKL